MRWLKPFFLFSRVKRETRRTRFLSSLQLYCAAALCSTDSPCLLPLFRVTLSCTLKEDPRLLSRRPRDRSGGLSHRQSTASTSVSSKEGAAPRSLFRESPFKAAHMQQQQSYGNKLTLLWNANRLQDVDICDSNSREDWS